MCASLPAEFTASTQRMNGNIATGTCVATWIHVCTHTLANSDLLIPFLINTS